MDCILILETDRWKKGVTNAEQAQAFLGVDDKTPDDFIITMYTAKVLSFIDASGVHYVVELTTALCAR